MSPVTDSETLPDPEPVAKKTKLTPVNISNVVDPFLERLGNMKYGTDFRAQDFQTGKAVIIYLSEDILRSSSSQQH